MSTHNMFCGEIRKMLIGYPLSYRAMREEAFFVKRYIKLVSFCKMFISKWHIRLICHFLFLIALLVRICNN